MRKFLIAAHGSFSSGIKSSLDFIIGETKNLYIIDAYIDNNKSIEDELQLILNDLKPDDELIVMSDLMGGSITNQILRFALQRNVHIVSGISLGLVIEIVMGDELVSAGEIIENAIINAREQMVYVNKLINKENDNA
ncbi:MAG: hypothetical protein ABI477_05210 [Chryseolinea sp.]